jgi:pimeloyl-ACP methyl ester carboxylesterase
MAPIRHSAAAACTHADPHPATHRFGWRNIRLSGVDLARGAERLLAPSSRMVVIDDAGHFLHLEKPGQVNDHILTWVS